MKKPKTSKGLAALLTALLMLTTLPTGDTVSAHDVEAVDAQVANAPQPDAPQSDGEDITTDLPEQQISESLVIESIAVAEPQEDDNSGSNESWADNDIVVIPLHNSEEPVDPGQEIDIAVSQLEPNLVDSTEPNDMPQDNEPVVPPKPEPEVLQDGVEDEIPRPQSEIDVSAYEEGNDAGFGFVANEQLNDINIIADELIDQDDPVHSTVSIKYATNMRFSALHENGGAITSPVYTIKNNSNFPLHVRYCGFSVIDSDGVHFVSESSSATDGSIVLNLELPSAYAGSNGLTKGVSGMATNNAEQLMGTLASRDSGGNSTGHFTIGGQYIGPFPTEAKHPMAKITFHFEPVKQ